MHPRFLCEGCLNQDLRDLGIYRMAGERLMDVERTLFAAGERADCRGPMVLDAPMHSSLSPS